MFHLRLYLIPNPMNMFLHNWYNLDICFDLLWFYICNDIHYMAFLRHLHHHLIQLNHLPMYHLSHQEHHQLIFPQFLLQKYRLQLLLPQYPYQLITLQHLQLRLFVFLIKTLVYLRNQTLWYWECFSTIKNTVFDIFFPLCYYVIPCHSTSTNWKSIHS